jgi:hypothetical protein
MGLVLACGAQARAETVYEVRYQCPVWKTKTFTSAKVAHLFQMELKSLAFETKLEPEPTFYKVQYRLTTGRTKTFTSEEMSHALRDWLNVLGCASIHNHYVL